MRTLNLFARSLIFSLFSLLTIAGYSLIVVGAFLLPVRIRRKMIIGFLRLEMAALKLICRIDCRVEGLDNLPANQNGIILSKHQSTWETFYLPILFKDPAIILKRELLRVPFFGWGLAMGEPIAIDRNNKTTAMQQIIRQGRKYLQEGRSVLVFPEGTRMAPGAIGHYKLGGARLATATGYPVIPVAHNAGRFWPRRKFIKRPGTITVVIGPLIDSQTHTADEVLALAKDWIETTMRRIDG